MRYQQQLYGGKKLLSDGQKFTYEGGGCVGEGLDPPKPP